MKEWKRILLAALVISIGARFYVNFLVDGFIITVSVILLFLTLYYFREIDPLKLGITVAILSPLMRFGFLLAFGETVHHAWVLVYPDAFFYLSYGLFFHLVTRRFAPSGEQFIAGGFFADLFSNIVEITVRVGFGGLSDHVINTLFTVRRNGLLIRWIKKSGESSGISTGVGEPQTQIFSMLTVPLNEENINGSIPMDT